MGIELPGRGELTPWNKCRHRSKSPNAIGDITVHDNTILTWFKAL